MCTKLSRGTFKRLKVIAQVFLALKRNNSIEISITDTHPCCLEKIEFLKENWEEFSKLWWLLEKSSLPQIEEFREFLEREEQAFSLIEMTENFEKGKRGN